MKRFIKTNSFKTTNGETLYKTYKPSKRRSFATKTIRLNDRKLANWKPFAAA